MHDVFQNSLVDDLDSLIFIIKTNRNLLRIFDIFQKDKLQQKRFFTTVLFV